MRIVMILILGFVAGTVNADVLESNTRWPVATKRIISAPDTNGAVFFRNSATDVTIGPVEISGAYRAIETADGVVLRGLRIDGLTARDLQRDGMRLRRVENGEISNFDLQMRTEPQTGKHLPEGIALYTGSSIVIRDGKVSGFRMEPATNAKTGKMTYTNGDGIATERGVDGLRIMRVTSSNNSDGGFDLKGRNIRLEDLTAIGNGKGYRIWDQVDAGRLASVDNKVAVHLLAGGQAKIERLVARSSGPGVVVMSEGSGSLAIGSCDLTAMAPGSVLVKRNGAGATITLGRGCILPK